jgi:hypothetical protein
MLAEGKIDVSEAEKLLNAIDSKETSSRKECSETAQQFFNVLIDSKKEGGTRVKIKVPLRLLKAGMKFVNLIPEESRKKIQIAMRDKGINFDLNEIDSLNADELLDALQALEIAVNDSETSESIRIFCG